MGNLGFMENMESKLTNRMKAAELSESDFACYVRGLDTSAIAPSVCCERMSRGMLADISAICRRCFKAEEVILFAEITPDEDYEEGIVFTENRMISWLNEGRCVNEIYYDRISGVDYDEDELILDYGGQTIRISLGDDADEEKYPRYMYSFLMDIIDYVKGNAKEV